MQPRSYMDGKTFINKAGYMVSAMFRHITIEHRNHAVNAAAKGGKCLSKTYLNVSLHRFNGNAVKDIFGQQNH